MGTRSPSRSGRQPSVTPVSSTHLLLANRILEKRTYQELDKEEPDLVRIRAGVEQLHQSNEMLITRSEELYRTVKNKSMTLVPTTLGQIKETTLERFYHKYPDARLKTDVNENVTVLADQNYLSEALYNLLINAWEANVAVGHGDRAVELVSHKERLYTCLLYTSMLPGGFSAGDEPDGSGKFIATALRLSLIHI